jgi:hypothetical protein
MATTYRTDWVTDPHGLAVDGADHGTNVAAARGMARRMSKAYGSACLIKQLDGQDVAQVSYTDGVACPYGWDAQ